MGQACYSGGGVEQKEHEPEVIEKTQNAEEENVKIAKLENVIAKQNQKINMLSLELKSLLAVQLSTYFAKWQGELDPLALKILCFWFGVDYDGKGVKHDMYDLWFGQSEFTDLRISFLFKDHLDHAAAGLYDYWVKHPLGLLALVILLDQFPRAIFRNSARSFAWDWKALNVVWKGIEAKLDDQLNVMERVFLYRVFTHAEDLEIQRLCVKHSQEKLEGMEDKKMWIKFFQGNLQVIERFGRFPHRNECLGRWSTKEEDTFMKNDPSAREKVETIFLDNGIAPGGSSKLGITFSLQREPTLTEYPELEDQVAPQSLGFAISYPANKMKALQWKENNTDL